MNGISIEELRIGYRIITGLDDKDLSDEEIKEYMQGACNE